MTANNIFEQTKRAYLCLIRPRCQDDAWRREIAPVVALAPSVPDELVATMITGGSWRERLLALCLAMARRPLRFTEAMLQSLRDPRGIAIVPVCAALTVLARRGTFAMPQSFSEMFNSSAFDGELGWATDKAMHLAGLRAEDVPGDGPNCGQIFADHIEVYDWIHAA